MSPNFFGTVGGWHGREGSEKRTRGSMAGGGRGGLGPRRSINKIPIIQHLKLERGSGGKK